MPRMRNYRAMSRPKLVECYLEITGRYGEAYERATASGEYYRHRRFCEEAMSERGLLDRYKRENEEPVELPEPEKDEGEEAPMLAVDRLQRLLDDATWTRQLAEAEFRKIDHNGVTLDSIKKVETDLHKLLTDITGVERDQ